MLSVYFENMFTTIKGAKISLSGYLPILNYLAFHIPLVSITTSRSGIIDGTKPA
jgi:hypothetical protein